MHKVGHHGQGGLGLIHGDHVSGIIDLQKGKLVIGAGQALLIPFVRCGGLKARLTGPVQGMGPGLIAEIIANKIDIAGINQGGIARIQQFGDIVGKVVCRDQTQKMCGREREKEQQHQKESGKTSVLPQTTKPTPATIVVRTHPIGMEFHVDSKIARFPAMRMLWIDAQSLFGTGQIEPVFNIGIVIAQGWFGTLNANIIGIQARRLVGTRQAGIAHQKGRLTGKFVENGIAGIAFLNHAGTMRHDRFHGLIRGLVKNLNPMGIVDAHFGIPGILHLGIGQAIANGQAGQVQVQQGRWIVVVVL